MNVLMVLWNGGGNVPPFVGIGRELLRRGHRVRCLGPESTRGPVSRAGMELRPLERGADFDPLEPLPLEASHRAQAAVFFGDGYREDLRAEVERERPDIILIDCFLAAAQAEAELLGLPFATLVHTLPGWFIPFWDQVLLAPTNALRERVGLAPAANTGDLWKKGDLTLVTSTSLLDSSIPGPSPAPKLQYVGLIGEPEIDGETTPMIDSKQRERGTVGADRDRAGVSPISGVTASARSRLVSAAPF